MKMFAQVHNVQIIKLNWINIAIMFSTIKLTVKHFIALNLWKIRTIITTSDKFLDWNIWKK